MRIAMVGIRGIPARAGGAERVVEELARELAERGHEIIVYCRREYIAGSDEPAFARRIVTPHMPGKHTETVTATATAMMDVLRRRVDVVHIHSPGPALMSWLPAAAGLPVVLTIHAADWQRRKWSAPAKAALRAGLWCGMRVADRVTCVAEGLAAELSARFGRDVDYIPNAVRSAQPRPPAAIARWGLADGRYALTVGRVVPEKRLDLLLEAWGGLADKNKVRLVVVGDVGDDTYGRRCRGLAGGDVLLLGPQFGEVLAELQSNALFAVQPSGLEGMSMAILEAAAYGLAILAADIKANLDTMGDSILYYSCEDREDLGRRLDLLLHSEELRSQLGQHAAAKVRSDYTWPAVADRMETVYRRAILTAKARP